MRIKVVKLPQIVFLRAGGVEGSQPPDENLRRQESLGEEPQQCSSRSSRTEAPTLASRTMADFLAASWLKVAAGISVRQWMDQPEIHGLHCYVVRLVGWWRQFTDRIAGRQWTDQPAVRGLRRNVARLIVWRRQFTGRISNRQWMDQLAIHGLFYCAVRQTVWRRQLVTWISNKQWADQTVVRRLLLFLGADPVEGNEPSQRSGGLFREEALAHAGRGETIGSVLLITPLPFIVFAWIAGAIMTALFVFVATVTVPRSQDLRGYLDVSGGVISILGAGSGTLKSLKAKPGHAVSIGDVLFHVEQSGTGDATAGAQKNELQYLKARRDLVDRTRRQNQASARQEIDQLLAKVRVKKDQMGVLKAQFDNLVKTTEIMKIQENRLKTLKKKKYASGTKLGEAIVAYHQAMNRTLASKKEITDAVAAIEDLNHQIGKQRAQIDMEELVASKKLLELDSQINKLTNRQVYAVKSTVNGIVTTVNVKNGQAITTDTEVLRILPDEGKLFASFPSQSDAIGLVEEGQAVQLRFDAFPYQKYGIQRGTVRSLTSTAISMDGRSFVPKGKENATGPVFLIEVALAKDFVVIAGKKRPLMPEMTVTGSVVLERRTILEWFLEPLMAARGKLQL